MEIQYNFFWSIVKDFQSLIVVFFGLIGYFANQVLSERKNIKILATSLLAEVNNIELLYFYSMQGGLTFEMTLKQPEGYNLRFLFISQNYFSIFENNTERLGFMDKKDVSEVTTFYMLAKGLADSHIAFGKEHEKYLQARIDCIKDGSIEKPEVCNELNSWVDSLPKIMSSLYQQQQRTFNQAKKVKKILQTYATKPTRISKWQF